MKINADLVLKARKEKSWSQEELAIASGLNLRTIQRIESEASAEPRGGNWYPRLRCSTR
jgi:transcriptional regulator with XRE-family HTH domain